MPGQQHVQSGVCLYAWAAARSTAALGHSLGLSLFPQALGQFRPGNPYQALSLAA